MSDFNIHTLGCGSAKPTPRHQPSCTVLNHRGNLMMIDCGEGAQQAFMKQRLKFNRLNHIFLTHLHGDHVLGLPGMLSTMALGNEGGSITVHTFEEGADILTKILDFFARERSYQLDFNIIKPEDALILETKSLSVRTVKLHHRVPTVGYIFEEKPKPRHIIRDMIDFHKVPFSYINRLRAGEDYIAPDGRIIPNHILTSEADRSLSYAHISDTIYMPELASRIGPVDLLMHETTYLEEHAKEAKARFHSTAKQAASVARDAGAARLLTGHYSSRYRDDSAFLKEAAEIFPNTVLNREGLVTTV
ncbi:MAG: ribonuclease Z [Muribaculaceae bacterium]|nr:ribonuclease Z [Muribaculaceae bacterium]